MTKKLIVKNNYMTNMRTLRYTLFKFYKLKLLEIYTQNFTTHYFSVVCISCDNMLQCHTGLKRSNANNALDPNASGCVTSFETCITCESWH